MLDKSIIMPYNIIVDIERRREIARNWARKNYWLNKGKMRKYYTEYWKNTTKERKMRRKKRNIMHAKKFSKAHPEAPMIYYKRNKEKWTNGIDCRNPKIWKTAEEKAAILIKELGYTDIYRPKFTYFYFDFLAKKEEKYVVFQVTTLRTRLIRLKHIELASYLNFDYYIIHVKPTFDKAYITKINLTPPPRNKNGVNYYYNKGNLHLLT